MTNVLSQQAAERIWKAHQEIEAGKKLLAEARKMANDYRDPTPLNPSGWQSNFTLGRGGYDKWQHISHLSPSLAIAVIEAHIADKERELKEASIAARIELEHQGND